VEELVQLGRYSHESLKELVSRTGIQYDRLERGILHFFSSQADFDNGAAGAEIMRRHGVDRRVLNREEVLKVEPALAAFGPKVFGGTYTPSDESGDAKVFTQKLARLCAERGAQFLYEHDILGLQRVGDGIESTQIAHVRTGERKTLKADAFVAAMGSYTPALVRPLGEWLNIYPAKGYSATLRLKKPEAASVVSLLDDTRKIAISRLGDHIRIAGTAELSGFDLNLDSPTAKVRCAALVRRYEELFPGVADTSEPNYWTGLRPSTPTNIPYIGRSKAARNLWLNAGHGTLGWTHGAGSGRAVAELIAGRKPAMALRCYNV
jgi:D-amino-acid dehydrogenase